MEKKRFRIEDKGEKMKKKIWMKRLAVGLLVCSLCVGNVAFAESGSALPTLGYEIQGASYVDAAGVTWVDDAAGIEIKAPAGYDIALSEDGTYASSAQVAARSAIPEQVYLKDQNSIISTIAVTMVQRDSLMPTAELSLSRGEETWNQMFSFITMSTFWKGGVTAEITAYDEESGVKTIEYFISDRDLTVEPNQGDELLPQKMERLIDGQWQAYNGPVPLREKATNVVYGKITDNVGNVKYVGSTGQNLYEDSQAAVTEVVYDTGTAVDTAVDVMLNGNAVDSITMDDRTLTSGGEYEVTSNQIILKGSFLETLAVGEYPLTIDFAPLGKVFDQYAKGDAPQKAELTLKVDVDTRGWGEKTDISGIPHYVDQDGRASVKVDNDDMIWLKETSDGMSTWIALDNRSGVFEKGSRLWVRILSEDADQVPWQRYYDQLDPDIKDAIEADQLMLFEVGVTGADGTVYHEFASKAALSVQMPGTWDESDTHLVYVSEDGDEAFDETITTQQSPQGEGRFLTAELGHFSCYAVYDGLNEVEKEALKPQQPGNDGQQGESMVQPEGPAGGESQGTNEGNGKGDVGQAGEDDNDGAGPETGDHNYFFIWIIVGLVAARILAKMLRKKNETNE